MVLERHSHTFHTRKKGQMLLTVNLYEVVFMQNSVFGFYGIHCNNTITGICMCLMSLLLFNVHLFLCTRSNSWKWHNWCAKSNNGNDRQSQMRQTSQNWRQAMDKVNMREMSKQRWNVTMIDTILKWNSIQTTASSTTYYHGSCQSSHCLNMFES